MKLSTVNVTPELAKTMLSKNSLNRPINAAHVQRIAHEMRNGRWVLNGQTVTFDQTGRLLDGQHRLSAVIEAGVTVKMAIAVGVTDPNAFKTYDSLHLKRGAGQIANMMGVLNSQKTVATARILHYWEQSATHEEFGKFLLSPGNYPKIHLNPSEMAEYALLRSEDINSARKIMGNQMVSSAGSCGVAMIAIFNDINAFQTLSFCEKLSSGADLKKGDAIILLRDKILSKAKYEYGSVLNWRMAGFFVKAFNSHLNCKTLKSLSMRTSAEGVESFPVIFGASKK